MLRGSQPQMNIFFQPDNSWRPPGVVATGEIGIHCSSASVFFSLVWPITLSGSVLTGEEQTTNQTNKKGKTQIPQPHLRLTIPRTAKQTAKAARANRNNHKRERDCQGLTQKHAANELVPTSKGETRDLHRCQEDRKGRICNTHRQTQPLRVVTIRHKPL